MIVKLVEKGGAIRRWHYTQKAGVTMLGEACVTMAGDTQGPFVHFQKKNWSPLNGRLGYPKKT